MIMAVDMLDAPINLFKSAGPDDWHVLEDAKTYGHNEDTGGPHLILVSFCGQIGDTSIENYDVYDLTGIEDYEFLRKEKLNICPVCHNNNYIPLCDWT